MVNCRGMTFGQLRTFLEVSRTGSVRRAAAALFVTEPSVSAAVSALSPSTAYHYRVVATNAAGTTRGSDQTFMTPAPPGAYSQAVLTDGPVSYWRFAESSGTTAMGAESSIVAVIIYLHV